MIKTLLFTDLRAGKHLKSHYRICMRIPQQSSILYFSILLSFLERQKKQKIHHFGTPLAEEASVSTFLTGFSFLAKLIFNGGWEASMTNICFPIHKQACELRLWTLPSEKSDSKMAGGGWHHVLKEEWQQGWQRSLTGQSSVKKRQLDGCL